MADKSPDHFEELKKRFAFLSLLSNRPSVHAQCEQFSSQIVLKEVINGPLNSLPLPKMSLRLERIVVNVNKRLLEKGSSKEPKPFLFLFYYFFFSFIFHCSS